jgi:hypothetical protein
MPDQEEHDRPENLVEPAKLQVRPAQSLAEEANSNNSLEGYAAMNGLNNEPIAEEALELEEQKAKAKQSGK